MNRLWCRMRVSCGMFDMIISEKTDNVKMRPDHHSDVMMGVMTSQITSLSIVYSTVYSGADQRKHQSSLSLQDIPYKMLIILFGVISSLVATGFIWVIFIRPFEKRDVLCRGNVRPSVCPSVCPSVRPSVRVFRTFLQHALRYQFETWYMHSVGGTTCRVWVASQLGQFDLVYSQK